MRQTAVHGLEKPLRKAPGTPLNCWGFWKGISNMYITLNQVSKWFDYTESICFVWRFPISWLQRWKVHVMLYHFMGYFILDVSIEGGDGLLLGPKTNGLWKSPKMSCNFVSRSWCLPPYHPRYSSCKTHPMKLQSRVWRGSKHDTEINNEVFEPKTQRHVIEFCFLNL